MQRSPRKPGRPFRQAGLEHPAGSKIGKVERTEVGVRVEYEHKDGAACSGVRPSDRFGRPHSEHRWPGRQAVGLKMSERGFIDVDAHCRTNLPNVWAVGDVVPGPMLAHKGMEEGVMVAECIAGQPATSIFDTVPWVIYTHPEIAWVGKTEAAAQGRGHRVQGRPDSVRGQRPRAGAGRHHRLRQDAACAATDRILGVHIIGNNASELIAEAVVAMEFGACRKTSRASATRTRPCRKSCTKRRWPATSAPLHF
jgi:dihydrolipoamide dehydrogenase